MSKPECAGVSLEPTRRIQRLMPPTGYTDRMFLGDLWEFDSSSVGFRNLWPIVELHRIAEKSQMVWHEFTIDVEDVWLSHDWREPEPTGTRTVYAISPEGAEEAVESRIREIAAGEGDEHLEDAPLLNRALTPRDEHDRKIFGWIEMTNGFLFFTDPVPWKKAERLFRRKE